jgi:ribosomal protein S18 acetylase RimI-like enzyme
MYEHPANHQHALTSFIIRPYRDADEQGWLRCSVLSFLETAYFDTVHRHKPRYDHPTIELVAAMDGIIVGAIDVECEESPGTVCTVCADEEHRGLGGMIWHLSVHPNFQRRGIGGRLLQEARGIAMERGVTCFEAWTRDDAGTLRWYESHRFEWVKSYLHVYLEGREEVEQALQSSLPGLKPVHVFAHYTGTDGDSIRARFDRVHDCTCFRLRF